MRGRSGSCEEIVHGIQYPADILLVEVDRFLPACVVRSRASRIDKALANPQSGCIEKCPFIQFSVCPPQPAFLHNIRKQAALKDAFTPVFCGDIAHPGNFGFAGIAMMRHGVQPDGAKILIAPKRQQAMLLLRSGTVRADSADLKCSSGSVHSAGGDFLAFTFQRRLCGLQPFQCPFDKLKLGDDKFTRIRIGGSIALSRLRSGLPDKKRRGRSVIGLTPKVRCRCCRKELCWPSRNIFATVGKAGKRAGLASRKVLRRV